MSKKLLSFFLAAIFLLSASESFEKPKEAVFVRWEAFQKDRSFIPFQPNRTDAELIEEFAQIDAKRRAIWEAPEFNVSEQLVANDLVRAPGCVAFAFNNTTDSYNASTIFLGRKAYIACEGPRSKDIPRFFQMLSSFGVTHLVRLTDSYEGEMKKCHPYWEGNLVESSDGGSRLEVPTEDGVYPVRAFDMAHWIDHEGISPDELLDLVL